MNSNTPQTVELDGRALKAEAEKSHEFLTLVHYGANRERNREVTDIEQMRKGIELKEGETLDATRWMQAFKKLEDMGLGSLIIGRRGNPNRFRWNYSLKAIGQAAVKGATLTAYRILPRMKGARVVYDYDKSRASPSTEEMKRIQAAKEAAAAARKAAKEEAQEYEDDFEEAMETRRPAPQPSAVQAKHHVYIALRPDFVFEAELPNLTAKEADVIIAAVKRCVKS